MLPNSESDIISSVEKVSPSVVNVNTIRLVHDYFYNIVPLKGMGSGFIIDPSGLILTNNHVIEGAERIQVTLVNGKVLQGSLVGSCASTDVALVKMNAEGLPAIQLGDSDKARVGQFVIAIGNPFGLVGGPTVTVGVVSALHRTIQSERGVLEDLIQTDAAINPGNSGGPLVDIKGNAIAISTAIVPFAQGIGFAVPINSAKRCTQDLLKYGRMVEPWLGIMGSTVTEGVASYYDLPMDRGVLVVRVVPGGPADQTGINVGDIVLEVDGTEVSRMEELLREIRRRKVGESMRLTLLREGRRWSVAVVLGRTP